MRTAAALLAILIVTPAGAGGMTPGRFGGATDGETPAPAAALAPGSECAATLDDHEEKLRAAPDDLALGSDYRHAAIRCAAYDRAIALFAQLTAEHPRSAHAWLNHGFAYVDQIPAVGSVRRAILANTALSMFDKAVELEQSWLALYTRGNSYLYWPAVFGRAPLAVADLEQAVAQGKLVGTRPYHARAWISLGDAYWKVGQPDRARAVWREAIAVFPGEPRLVARLGSDGEALAALIDDELDPARRVDTDLSVLDEGQ